jgi:hypothetical protein
MNYKYLNINILSTILPCKGFVELYEKNGGRHQRLTVENEDIIRARAIDDLKMK